MKTDRSCPDCKTTFGAVADYCICPNCARRFYASDPGRPMQHRMPPLIEFQASDVGFEESGGILNIWLDDQQDSYLAFQRVSEDHLEEYDDRGYVQIEVNDQRNACTDGFDAVVLTPNKIVVQFTDDEVMDGLTSVVAHFGLGDAFEPFRQQFAVLMRDKTNYHFHAEQGN